VSARILALMAKAPLPGQVKTRLCPPLSPMQAAELYTCMLLDVLDRHDRIPGVDLGLWYAPEEERSWFERHAPSSYRLQPQQGLSLAERMHQVVCAHSAEGYEQIVLRGTDSPTLASERIDDAYEALARADLVLCPDRDGGLRAPREASGHAALFDLETSMPDLLRRTLARARELGLRVELLPGHTDVDTVEDLQEIQPQLVPSGAMRTHTWLCKLDPSVLHARGEVCSREPALRGDIPAE